jgi:hypothetical protein
MPGLSLVTSSFEDLFSFALPCDFWSLDVAALECLGSIYWPRLGARSDLSLSRIETSFPKLRDDVNVPGLLLRFRND